MLVYASTADLASLLEPSPVPDNAAVLLRSASDLVRRQTLTAQYPTFPSGLPAGKRTAEAFQRATVLQVRWWIETGDATASGSPGVYQSVSILGVALTRAAVPVPAADRGGLEPAPGVFDALAAASVWSPVVAYVDEILDAPIGQEPDAPATAQTMAVAASSSLAATATSGPVLVPDWLFRHVVTVHPKTGDGAYGPVYGPPVELSAFVVDKRRLVRDATGAEVVSETTFACALAADVPVGSLALVSGRATTVLAVSRGDGGGLATPDHLEVACA